MEKTLWELDQEWGNLGISDEPIENYHKSPGLSFSGLKTYSITPAHYFASKDQEDDETASQRLGTIAHMAILEPNKFNKIVKPIDGHRGKTSVKDMIAMAESEGMYVCKPEEYETACRLSESILKNKTASQLLSGGKAEQSIRWRHPVHGMLLKCRPDYFRPDGMVVDLKTFSDLSEYNLQKQIARMKYHWQSVFYLTGVNRLLNTHSNMFVHIFLDTKAYVSRIVVIDDASLEKAIETMEPLMYNYFEHLRANNWPGYPDEILTTNLPSYEWGF